MSDPVIKPELYRRYRVRVRARRGEGWKLRPGTEAIDGREFVVVAEWQIGEEERPQYKGEFALYSRELYDACGINWIASGDVVFLEELGDTL